MGLWLEFLDSVIIRFSYLLTGVAHLYGSSWFTIGLYTEYLKQRYQLNRICLFFTCSLTLLSHIPTNHAYSHFHLDHCGALPYMSEMVGYDGPIYMGHPTKAICPILLEDFRKITVDKRGETNFFTSQMIKDCMKKVVPINLHQTVQVSTTLVCGVVV